MAFCTECGANVPAGTKFCTECGAVMTAAAAPERAAPVNPPAAPKARDQMPPPAAYAPPPAQPTTAYAASPAYAPQPPAYQAQPAAYPQPGPPKTGPYAVIGTFGFIGLMLLYAIPVLGFAVCAVMAFTAKNLNRRAFSRAVLVFMVLGLILCIAGYFMFSWVYGAFLEYINEAAGSVGGLNGILGQ